MAGQFGRTSYTEAALAGTAAVLFSTVFYAYNLVLVRRQALVAQPIEISFFQNMSLTILLSLAAPWLAISCRATFGCQWRALRRCRCRASS